MNPGVATLPISPRATAHLGKADERGGWVWDGPMPQDRACNLLELAEQRLKGLSRRHGLRCRVAELSVAGYEIVAVRRLESDKDGQIRRISEAVSRVAHLFHGWILDGRQAAIQQGDEASLFHLRKSEVGPCEDFHHLPVDMSIGDQVARTVAGDLEEEAFLAREHEAADQCVRVNEQLHDTASSRIPSLLREGSVPIARG